MEQRMYCKFALKASAHLTGYFYRLYCHFSIILLYLRILVYLVYFIIRTR